MNKSIFAAMIKSANPMSLEAIAERLIMLRESFGMNQTEFCRHVGFTQQALGNYEHAERRINLDQSIKLVQKTGVTLDWIYFGDDSQLPIKLYRAMGLAEKMERMPG